jgi:NADPH-dependent 2,4-dienoyl-CoA reductase/sulfur reductase-like enzyme/rhodanese-related sulfurtransferase
MESAQLRIAIVGGVAGGASAATRARRMNEHAEIILFEKDEYVSFANCGLPYYIGGEIQQRDKLLVATADFLRRRFQLDVRTRQEVQRIDRQAKTLTVLDHATGATYEQGYDRLILAPGAAPLLPPLEGIDAPGVFTLRNMADTDAIKQAAEQCRSKRAVVVGTGYIGLEMVEQLVRLGFQVSLAELQPQVLPMLDPEMAKPLEDALRRQGVQVVVGDGIQRVLTDDTGHASGVELQSGTAISGDLVILGLGVRPNVALAAEAGLHIGSSGGIATNQFMQTNDPDIYAVGDAAEYTYGPTGQPMRIALAGPANRAGRLAGEHAATGKSQPMAPVLGTSIVRVFDCAAGMTGLTTKLAKQLGLTTSSVTIVANDHAGYYPEATPITLKLIYDRQSGRVLGAQAVGTKGVDKRIDVIATLMALNGTVRDLAGLDLAYAPPFGSAKDPVHQAAFAACNQLDGVEAFTDPATDLVGKQVVDVRTVAEVQSTPLAASNHTLNIPLDELRERIGELDPGAETIISCGMGLRAHVAARILLQRGFVDVKNLSGGATVRNRAVAPANQD